MNTEMSRDIRAGQSKLGARFGIIQVSKDPINIAGMVMRNTFEPFVRMPLKQRRNMVQVSQGLVWRALAGLDLGNAKSKLR
jgi:hypothetical protein